MLFFNRDGSIIPCGRIVKRRTANFEDGTLPDWLDVPDGTSEASSLDPGGVVVTSAASVNANATVQGPEIDLSTVDAVRLQAAFTNGGNTGRSFRFGFIGASSGGYMFEESGSTGHVLSARNGGTVTSKVIQFRTAYDKRFVLSLIITTDDRTVYIGEKDHVWAHYTFDDDMALGVVRPMLRWTSTAGAAVSGHVHQLEIETHWR